MVNLTVLFLGARVQTTLIKVARQLDQTKIHRKICVMFSREDKDR